jgi:Phosphotransferase enzyme family
MTIEITQQKSDEALWDCVQRMLSDLHNSTSPITTIEHKRSELSSSYECEIVTVELADGQRFRLFLKSFGFSNIPKHQPRERAERELRVYRDLLVHAALGTPIHYGSVWNEDAGRYWLLLEFVEGQQLRHCEIVHWIRAAAWLGRMQSYFTPRVEELSHCVYLVRHDAEFFLSKAERATRALYQYPPSHRERLANILSSYEQLTAFMANQPQTLVHGHYRPQNILVGIDAATRRLCPVDWEVAALGSPIYDLAHLLDGFEGPMLEELVQAYCAEAGTCGVSRADGEDLLCILNCFWLHRTITLLGKAVEERFPMTGVMKLLDRAEMFNEFLRNTDHR